eukprot:CAMPEP_0115728062 /NCGR_PEP_ID=MMETSP0272-20121206/82773_1 /TAXON_ID=71861 /ORGANISM="Scrippsiella trochoidea, Strain CCMP3099" /LENGTH=279 /DNA_ID=CAMNT_0003171651 /DNA_START=95 /DNA_END=935 /DNA_ORIENTATION=-
MAADPLPPPLPRLAGAGIEAEEEGPLWNTIKRQLYRPEVSHVKRLVGDTLIQQNRAMWDELTSLRQIMAEFEQQNDELSESVKRQVQLCGTQHRDLLRRQAQIITEDLRSQAVACGHVLEDLVPEFRDEALRDFVAGCGGAAAGGDGCLSLLALISEQMQRFEAEEARRVSTRAGPTSEPSTAMLQGLVRKLQDLTVSPSLRSLMVAGNGGDDAEFIPRPISGGANVRRLKALIAERRRGVAALPAVLGAVPEVAGKSKRTQGKPAFDPFFGDPFAADT